MSKFHDDFETGGTVGTTITGWTAASVAAVYGDANPLHGTRHMRVDNPGTTIGQVRRDTAATGPIEAIGFFYLSTLPGADLWLISGSATSFRVQVIATNRLRILAQGVTIWTSTDALTAGVYYRLGIHVDPGTSATTGAVTFAYYLGDSLTPIETFTVSAINVANTAAAIESVTFGKINSGSYTGIIDVDSASVHTGADATTDFLPPEIEPSSPVGPTTLTANAGAWTNVGGAASIPAALRDDSDSTYALSPGAVSGEDFIVKFAPLASGDIKISLRMSLDIGESSGDVTFELRQGTTVIKTLTPGTTPGWPALTTTAQLYEYTLTSGELAGITDRANLHGRWVAN